MDETLQLPGLISALRRRSRLIAAITIGGTALIGLAAYALPTRYTAKAQIIVEHGRATLTPGNAVANDGAPDQITILTELAILASYDLLDSVRTQLAADPEFQTIWDAPAGPNQSWAGRILRGIRGSVRNPATVDAPTVENLQRNLKAFQEAGSHVIALSYTSARAEEAAAIANKTANWYVEQRDAKRRTMLDQALAGVTEKLAELRAETERLEASTQAYQTARGMKDAAKTNVIDQRLGDLNRQLSEAQSDLAVRDTRLLELSSSRGPAGDWSGLLSSLDPRGLIDLHGQIVALLQSRRDGIVVVSRPDASQAAGANDPATRSLREKLRGELDLAIRKLTDDATIARSRVSELRERLRSVQDASDDTHLRDLVSTAASARQRYENLLRHRDELVIQRDGLTPMARLLSRAPVPERPSSPNPLLFVAPGAVAFLTIGCLVALVRERTDKSLRAETDIASSLGTRCAGLVPNLPPLLPARSISNATALALAAYSETIRSILISQRLVGLGERTPKVILVTSSLPGEGKSLLAASLAVLASRSGARVLLLDLATQEGALLGAPFDKVMPTALKALGPEKAAPRSSGGATASGGRLETRRGLTAEATPIFSREQAESALQELRGDYDLIVIDAAPVLLRAETRLLAAVADRVVFCVRWGKTGRDEARNALALLRGPGSREPSSVSAVLTQVDFRRHAAGHPGDQAEALTKYALHYAK